jgi:protein-disulfide isomerase
MKHLIGAAALALMVAGCGGEGGNSSGQSAAGGTGGTPAAPVTAPNGDWTQVVVETPEGGMRMGNPDAPVKIVEFASLTCSHCATFSKEGEPALIDRYVKTGQASFELRNFIRDPADLAAALLSRCGGTGPYFKLTDQLFAAQGEWLGRVQGMSEEAQRAIAANPQTAPAAYAEQLGLIQFVKARGIPEAKARACLADQANTERLVSVTGSDAEKFNVQGTPTFAINGKTVDLGPGEIWPQLEPKIKAAVGG